MKIKKIMDVLLKPLKNLIKLIYKYKYTFFIVLIIAVFAFAYAAYKWFCIDESILGIWESLAAVIAVMAVFIQLLENRETNEAELIKELNSEFINNEQLNNVEHKFEIYYDEYKHAKNSLQKKNIKLDLDLGVESKERQHLVNYLVHLEMIAALVNDNVLRLNAINDLIAYRFFIAVHNPIVQQLELGPFKEYYMGCYKLHKRWTKRLHRLEKKKGKDVWNSEMQSLIPMEEYGDFFEEEFHLKENLNPKLFKTIEEYIQAYYEDKVTDLNPTAYFFDLSQIRENIRELEKEMPLNIKVYYAMKANPNKDVMDCICQMKFIKGIEIASSGELKYALKYCQNNKVIFTGPGKTEYELEQAIKKGIKYINVESIAEAVRINKIAKDLDKKYVNVLLRVNIDYSVMNKGEKMAGYSTKMGIDEKVFFKSFRIIQNMERIRIKGIHAFAASGILDYKVLVEVNRYIFEFVAKVEKKFGNIKVIDFGGGLGIDYSNKNRKFNLKCYKQELRKLIKEYQFCDKEIIMELGTYITGNAGYYTAKIIDIKKTKGKKHIVIAGGVNHMGLPLEMRRKHPILIIPMNEPKLYPEQMGVCSEVVDISGPLCIVSDKLSWNEKVKKAEIGDIVVFRQAGAYCYEEGMHEFLMHSLPEVNIFDKD